jgi:hypothetical protein
MHYKSYIYWFHQRRDFKNILYVVICLKLYCNGGHFVVFFVFNDINVKMKTYIVREPPVIIHIQFGFNQVCSFWNKPLIHFLMSKENTFCRVPSKGYSRKLPINFFCGLSFHYVKLYFFLCWQPSWFSR